MLFKIIQGAAPDGETMIERIFDFLERSRMPREQDRAIRR